MAARATFTLNEVIDELDGSNLFEEDESEDDFDGYLDDDDVEYEREMEETEAGDLDIGENVQIGPSGDDDLPEYTLTPGCSTSLEGNSPFAYFSLLMTPSILQHIVDQTNLYADQFISSHDLCPHSRVRRWAKRVHDVCELLQFLAIIIIMGIVRYPHIESHWSTLWPYSNTHFASVSL